jgi:hypothetical protein
VIYLLAVSLARHREITPLRSAPAGLISAHLEPTTPVAMPMDRGDLRNIASEPSSLRRPVTGT